MFSKALLLAVALFAVACSANTNTTTATATATVTMMPTPTVTPPPDRQRCVISTRALLDDIVAGIQAFVALIRSALADPFARCDGFCKFVELAGGAKREDSCYNCRGQVRVLGNRFEVLAVGDESYEITVISTSSKTSEQITNDLTAIASELGTAMKASPVTVVSVTPIDFVTPTKPATKTMTPKPTVTATSKPTVTATSKPTATKPVTVTPTLTLTPTPTVTPTPPADTQRCVITIRALIEDIIAGLLAFLRLIRNAIADRFARCGGFCKFVEVERGARREDSCYDCSGQVRIQANRFEVLALGDETYDITVISTSAKTPEQITNDLTAIASELGTTMKASPVTVASVTPVDAVDTPAPTPVPTQDDDDNAVDGSIIFLIVALCVIVVLSIVAIIYVMVCKGDSGSDAPEVGEVQNNEPIKDQV